MVAFLTKLGPCPWSLQPQPQRRQSLLSSRPYPSLAASATTKLCAENEGYHKGARGWSEK